jgi:hypothetical protein
VLGRGGKNLWIEIEKEGDHHQTWQPLTDYQDGDSRELQEILLV